jgi:hypothetical protein
VQKVGSYQAPLRFIEYGVRFEGVLHLCGTRLEYFQEIFVAAFEIFEHLDQLFAGGFSLKT